VSGRAAAHKVEEADHIKLKMPLLGSIRLPEPQRLAYYTTIGALGVLGVLEWPVALVLAGGHALASDQHNRAVQQFGEALEDAWPARRRHTDPAAPQPAEGKLHPFETFTLQRPRSDTSTRK